MLERPNICYIFGKLKVQGCQIWHSHVLIPFNSAAAHSTRPHNAKNLFTSSFQAKFLKIRFTKVAGTSSFLVCQQIFFFPNLNHSQGHIWAKMSHHVPPLTPKKWPKRTHIGQKWQKEWCYHTFVKEWMKALDKTRILAPSDYFYYFSFPRYGCLKSKFLCERYSHCIFSSCSIDLTKTRYTWSLTAVIEDWAERKKILPHFWHRWNVAKLPALGN